jgi:hypothetical protein
MGSEIINLHRIKNNQHVREKIRKNQVTSEKGRRRKMIKNVTQKRSIWKEDIWVEL